MTDPDRDIRDRLAHLEAMEQARSKREAEQDRTREKMAEQLDELVADMHRRQGIERRTGTQRQENHERNEWIRALFPSAILTAVWVGVWTWVRETFGGGP